MNLFFTEIWVLPPIPPTGGAFPYWSWGCEGPNAPYSSYTWDVGNKRYTEIDIGSDPLVIRLQSDTTYLGDNILDSYNYTLALQGVSPTNLDLGFTQVDDGIPVRIVTLRLSITTYPYTKFPVVPVTNEGDYTQVEYTDEVPYSVSIFKTAPLERKYIYINPGGLIGNACAWKYLLFPPFKDLFPGLFPVNIS